MENTLHLIIMRVVCRIYRGRLEGRDGLTLEELAPYAHHFYQHRPRMIKYRESGVSLLVFTSMQFRLMGGGENHLRVLQKFLQRLPWHGAVQARNVLLSTMTVTHQLEQTSINLHRLGQQSPQHFVVELELFPAAAWINRGGGREHVNVFHTGCVVITGVQSINSVACNILPLLTADVENALHCRHSVLSAEAPQGGLRDASPAAAAVDNAALCLPPALSNAPADEEGSWHSQLYPSQTGRSPLERGL